MPGGCSPLLANVPFFGQNPRGSPDFETYPTPTAYQPHRLGTWVPRCLAVAHSASSPKAGLTMQPYRPALASLLAGSPARRRPPQCSGYRHWISYCCVDVCLGLSFTVTPAFLAGDCGVCARIGVSAFFLPFPAGACRVCAFVPLLPLARRDWLEFLVFALWYGLWFNPAYPGPGLWRVCMGTDFA